MKKPSERIRQIADEHGIPNHEGVPAWIIASYLDEQFEARIHKQGWCDKCQGFHDKEEIMP